MQEVVSNLVAKGLVVDDVYKATNYLKYNTTWNMLKRSLWLKYEYQENKLDGITFDEVRRYGLIEYYMSQANLFLINTLEHQLKVYISRIYQELSVEERIEFERKVIHLTKRGMKGYKKHIDKSSFKTVENLENFFDSCNGKVYQLFEIYYFKDFLKIYKYIPKDKRICRIDYRINSLRNSIYHHDQLLKYEKTRNTNRIRSSNRKIIDVLDSTYNIEQTDLRILQNHAANNSATVQINLLHVTLTLLSQSESTNAMYHQVKSQYSTQLQKATEISHELQEIQQWLTSYLNIATKIIDESDVTNEN